MRAEKVYKDGHVDVYNKAILDETGITVLEYPKLAKTAEFVGTIASMSLLAFGMAGYGKTESLLPHPKNRRKIGYTVITLGAMAGIATINSGGI